MHNAAAMSDVRPFRIQVADEELTDLRERLERVRWTEELPDSGGEYGVPLAWVQEHATYWRDRYSWREREAHLNSFPQFTTTIDGQRVHFVHVRSAEEEALPLILSHGWPGSFVEFLHLVGRLTDGDEKPRFHLVIPSLPGYTFSGPTTTAGWNTRRIAFAWAELMRRLGYGRYGAVGNDWGSEISLDLARIEPNRLVGVHVTQIPSLPVGKPGELDDLTPEEDAALADRQWFLEHMGAYHQMQAQQPQTIAHALADSPIGLLAWNGQIFASQGVDADFAITNVMLYWLTRTAASAMRLYYENARVSPPADRTSVPVGLAQFSNDFQSIRPFAERDHASIVSWNRYPVPGHYAAHQSPDLLAGDIRAFFEDFSPHRPAQLP